MIQIALLLASLQHDGLIFPMESQSKPHHAWNTIDLDNFDLLMFPNFNVITNFSVCDM